MIKLYLARSMSGRIKEEVVNEAKRDREYLEAAGFIVLCPVQNENVKAEKSILLSSKEQMTDYWKRDKRMIEESHILLDMTPGFKSEGVSHEIGYARYFLYRPVIRVYPLGQLPNPGSVAYFEDDAVVDSLEEAIEYIYRVHGTFWKRVFWRINLYFRCSLKMIKCFLEGWK